MPELVTIGETMVSFAPEANGPLRYVDRFRKRYAGAESNLAIGVTRLGHTSGWISKVGDDEFGQYIRQQVRGEGVDISNVSVDADASTGIMFKEILQDKETNVHYYRKNSAASRLAPEDIDKGYVAGAKILHITGITPALSESCRRTLDYAIACAKESGVTVSFDPNIRLKLWGRQTAVPVLLDLLHRSDIVLLGLDEAEILFRTRDVGKIFDILLSGGAMCAGLKLGGEGAWVADRESRFFVPPFPATKVDSVGAGDAFNAGFLCGCLEKAPLLECGKMGCAMGAFAITSMGDIESLPSRVQLENFINGYQPATR